MSQTQVTHTDSLDGSDHQQDGEKKQKNRRPASMDTPGPYFKTSYRSYADDSLLNRHRIPTTAPESMAVSTFGISRDNLKR